MEFLVEFEINVPEGASAAEADSRNEAEAAAARKLAEQGHIVRVWRRRDPAGEGTVLGLYRADSEAELEGMLRALPLYDWMNVAVVPLEPHPNDPGAPPATTNEAAESRP